ncbi:unnamed protein product [Amoebophrya sp. A25]|nr:unnamed protein product [Amoebophrya sp. A25]|eukprot:GSA25T00016561001.1
MMWFWLSGGGHHLVLLSRWACNFFLAFHLGGSYTTRQVQRVVAFKSPIVYQGRTLDPCDAGTEFDLVVFKRWPKGTFVDSIGGTVEHWTPEEARCMAADVEFLTHICRRAMQIWNQLIGPAYYNCMDEVKHECNAEYDHKEREKSALLKDTEVRGESKNVVEQPEDLLKTSTSEPGLSKEKSAENEYHEERLRVLSVDVCRKWHRRSCSGEVVTLSTMRDGYLTLDAFERPDEGTPAGTLSPVQALPSACSSAVHKNILEQVRYDFLSDYVKTHYRDLEVKGLRAKRKADFDLAQYLKKSGMMGATPTPQQEESKSVTEQVDTTKTSEIRVRQLEPDEAFVFDEQAAENRVGLYRGIVNLKYTHINPTESMNMWYGGWQAGLNSLTNMWLLKKQFTDREYRKVRAIERGSEGTSEAVAHAQEPESPKAASTKILEAYIETPTDWVHGAWTERQSVICNLAAKIAEEKRERAGPGQKVLLRIAEVGIYLGLATLRFLNQCVRLFDPTSPEHVLLQYHAIDPWSESVAGYNASAFFQGKTLADAAMLPNETERERRKAAWDVSFSNIYQQFEHNLRTKMECSHELFEVEYPDAELQQLHEDPKKRQVINSDAVGFFIHRASSTVAATRIDELDLVFIDGDHTLSGVSKDLVYFGHIVRRTGGILAGHDWNLEGYESVAVAVTAYRLGLHKHAHRSWFDGPIHMDSDYTWWMRIRAAGSLS